MKEKKVTCTQCERSILHEDFLNIDGDVFCRLCIHDGADPISIYPVGVIRKGYRGNESRIILQPFMERFLLGLDEERHLTIVYLLHKSGEITTRFSRRLDQKSVGVFASRTPSRPTPIAITEVELVRIKGTILTVRGLDAKDNSPVLDIKLGYKEILKQKS